MERLVVQAESKLGAVAGDRCYCLKLPAVLGGQYKEANLGTITRSELLSFSGYLAEQIRDVADGDQVKIVIGPDASEWQ